MQLFQDLVWQKGVSRKHTHPKCFLRCSILTVTQPFDRVKRSLLIRKDIGHTFCHGKSQNRRFILLFGRLFCSVFHSKEGTASAGEFLAYLPTLAKSSGSAKGANEYTITTDINSGLHKKLTKITYQPGWGNPYTANVDTSKTFHKKGKEANLWQLSFLWTHSLLQVLKHAGFYPTLCAYQQHGCH